MLTPETVRTASLYPLATLEERTAGTTRLLVTRHWPRGVSRFLVSFWLPALAPTNGLLKVYRAGELDWPSFAVLYRSQVQQDIPKLQAWFDDMFRAYQWQAVTLLCVEHCPRDGHDETDIRCHRRLLRDLLLADTLADAPEMPEPIQ